MNVVTVYVQISVYMLCVFVCVCVVCSSFDLTSCLASLYLLAGENQRVEQEATLPRKK